jgi:fluoroacetyl-CoA thioesterase
MKETLQPGLTFRFPYRVPEDKTVPHLYADAEELQHMPRVFATGFMVGLFELACIRAVNPYLDWPGEQTVGIHVNVSHTAATPPGMTVTVEGKLEKVEGRKLTFSLSAFDGKDAISTGTHTRFVIDAKRFNEAVEKKRAAFEAGKESAG